MTKYNWDVSPEEKNRILNIHESATKNHYLLVEQSQPPSFTVDFNNTFSSGKYDFNPNYEGTVNEKIEQIVNYIKSKQLKEFKILITPGESQVRNQINPETGVRFGVGELAQKRAEVLKGYMEKALQASLSYLPKIEVAKSVIGTTPPGGDRNDPKYVAEQFVKASIIITSVNNQQPKPYNANSNIGESIFLNNSLVGFAHVSSRETNNISDAGNKNTGRENVIFTEIKKDTQPPIVLAKYSIPFSWWNQRGTTNTLTLEQLNFIRANFKPIS